MVWETESKSRLENKRWWDSWELPMLLTWPSASLLQCLLICCPAAKGGNTMYQFILEALQNCYQQCTSQEGEIWDKDLFYGRRNSCKTEGVNRKPAVIRLWVCELSFLWKGSSEWNSDWIYDWKVDKFQKASQEIFASKEIEASNTIWVISWWNNAFETIIFKSPSLLQSLENKDSGWTCDA